MALREKKIGFFGGTFDPVHFGHLNLAIELMERHRLDQVLFCPANYSPHKSDDLPTMDRIHRYQMTMLAIEPIEKFQILDWEIQREGPSYTIDTLRYLIEQNQHKEEKVHWHLILGEDSLINFFSWKEAEHLAKLAPPLIGSRNRHLNLGENEASAPLIKTLKKGLTQIPLIEISSTVIRERLKKHLFCGHLLPAKVLDYIQQNRLYSSP
jgi:nicotinate-nucleotide adenylyltransferase